MDLDHYIQESKNQEEARIRQLKERQKDIGNELMRQQEHKELKRKQIEEELKKKKYQ